MVNEQAIGIFDSGIGGTSILKEIHALLPHENLLYLADSKNAPYGHKPKSSIIELSIKNTEFLIEQHCKVIVVACNTATTNAIEILRANYDVPFIGIEPAIKPAALNSRTKSIGILATKGTLSSALFHKTSDLFARDINVIEKDGEGIVPLIEKGLAQSEAMRALLTPLLRPMIAAQIDYLVLGCSHYPYLIPILKEMLPSDISIIDSGAAVAQQTYTILKRNNGLNTKLQKPKIILYSNGDTEVLKDITDHSFEVRFKDF